MRIVFSIPSGMDVEDLSDLLTRDVWITVTQQPGFGALYPGYYVSMRSIVRRYLTGKTAEVAAGPEGEALLTLDAPGDAFDGLGAELAGEIVCGLAELFMNSRCLDLITRDIPAAIIHSLERLPAAVPLVPPPARPGPGGARPEHRGGSLQAGLA